MDKYHVTVFYQIRFKIFIWVYNIILIYPVNDGYLRKNTGWEERQNVSCPRNRYFSQITLTNRIYLFNSAQYLTVSKTVACKQHCRLEPRNYSVGCFFTIQINPVKFKITADTVVCHFSLLYRWLEEETRVIRNYIRDVINDLKKGFFSRAWYLLRLIPRYTKFPRTYTPSMGKKRKKLRIGKKYPLNQPIRRQQSYIRWNYRVA
jgi:hypothetical protein